jgi:hypothetical protein
MQQVWFRMLLQSSEDRRRAPSARRRRDDAAPADRARRVAVQPHVDALLVEQMPARRQPLHRLPVPHLAEAHHALHGGGGAVLVWPSVPIVTSGGGVRCPCAARPAVGGEARTATAGRGATSVHGQGRPAHHQQQPAGGGGQHHEDVERDVGRCLRRRGEEAVDGPGGEGDPDGADVGDGRWVAVHFQFSTTACFRTISAQKLHLSSHLYI